MNCTRIREVIEDYLYGELDERAAAGVSGHLQTCASCASALAALEREGQVYQAFSKAESGTLEITPEMWLAVRERLAPASAIVASNGPKSAGKEGRARPIFPLPYISGFGRQVAFAVLLIVVSVAGTLVAVRHWGSGRQVGTEPESRAGQPANAGEGLRANGLSAKHNALEEALLAIQRAEQEYIEAINLLSTIVEKRKSTLDPQLASELERNLRAIDQAIQSTRKAYKDRPQDPERALFMLRAYARKVELLQELVS
jgi:hypothetical protein